MRANKELEIDEEWAVGPVIREGDSFKVSWSVRVEESDQFKKIVRQIDETGVKTFHKEPQWMQSYWSLITKDLAGNTVDIYHEPKEAPHNTVWRD